MNSKYATTSTLVLSDFEGFEVCDRTTQVNYEEIKKLSAAMFGAKHSIGLAIKLNLRGMKIKPDDYFKIGGTTVKVADMVRKIHEQEGYGAEAVVNKSLGKESAKNIVSLVRLARAFAAETTHAVAKGIVTVEKELADMATESGLEVKYAFLAAPWGMDDAILKKNMEALYKFAARFDAMIKEAHKAGWCEGFKPREHAKIFADYLKFRGITYE